MGLLRVARGHPPRCAVPAVTCGGAWSHLCISRAEGPAPLVLAHFSLCVGSCPAPSPVSVVGGPSESPGGHIPPNIQSSCVHVTRHVLLLGFILLGAPTR